MRKTIASLLTGLALIATPFSLSAEEEKFEFNSKKDFKVGDKIPDFSKNYTGLGAGVNGANGKTWVYILWDEKIWRINDSYVGDGKPDYMQLFLACGDKVRGNFSTIDLDLHKVYRDINLDGYIDEIVGSRGRSISEDAPDCPK
ncbi:MAG: hypothetical protein AABX93_01035 [Nanoarchaeota archaeon]